MLNLYTTLYIVKIGPIESPSQDNATVIIFFVSLQNETLLHLLYSHSCRAVYVGTKTFLINFFRDDYLRASRALLREIVRALRHELDFVALCRGFMKERTESQFKDLDATLKVS